MKQEIDIARVLCALEDLPDGGCRGFTAGEGDWPLRGLLVRVGDEVRGYVNRCPHAGHPLDLLPGRFLSPDGALILCSSHGALFDKLTGSCIAGPCAGRSLRAVPLRIVDGYVMLADDVDVTALAEDRL
ncbi:MAG: Rieske (2Fe-2S) protein [Pseudomonadota bacterium]|nr:MAG: (2Fe-2S)-binding protein [Pseudomonadota bacterium]